jgi:RNA polymerase sigma-70 factor (ECF subfamily)
VVERAQTGDSGAYGILYEQHSKAMFNICMRMLGNMQNAQDILHEAFLIAFKNLQQLKEPSRFAGWLKKIVINECIRFSKTRFTNNEFSQEVENIQDEGIENWFTQVSFEQLEREIEALPEGYRQVFTLYAVEDYSHKEIAALMNVSESTSKSQYHRARQLLKKNILKNLPCYG